MANNSNYFPLAGSSMGLGAKDLFTAFGPEPQFGTKAFEQVKSSQPKTMEDVINSIILKNANAPTQAEQFQTMVPFLKEMSTFQADLANKNAQRKFGQEMLGAGIGALGRGIQTSIAGGSPEMLAYIAQGPVRAAEAYQRGITSMPRQDVPVFAARPTPDRRYFS
jgi:hypothetical protein